MKIPKWFKTEPWKLLDDENFRKTYPRDGEPWKLAEDRRLLAAYKQGEKELQSLPQGQRYAWWHALSKPFGRTSQAIRSRLWGLRAGERAAKPQRKRAVRAMR